MKTHNVERVTHNGVQETRSTLSVMRYAIKFMKVLLATIDYPPARGGVANYYEQVIKYWPSRGDIFVLNNNENRLIKNQLPILKWLPSLFAIKNEIRKNKIDHVLVGQVIPIGTAVWLLAKFIKIKYSVFLHGMDIEMAKKNKRKKWLADKVLAQAERIICNSKYTKGLVDEEFRGKCAVVTPGVEIGVETRFVASQEEDIKKYSLENKIILFSVGRLVKRKGFDRVIEVMAEIEKEMPDLLYVIAGSGPDEEYLKARAKGLANVIFLGEVSDEDKWQRLKDCDIFIMPARNINGDVEGFGIVYLEANLMGRPVIAGKSGGVSEAVIDNKTGILVDQENIQEIKDAIIKLARDKDLREKLGEEGRKRAIKEFKWEEKVGKIYKMVELKKS